MKDLLTSSGSAARAGFQLLWKNPDCPKICGLRLAEGGAFPENTPSPPPEIADMLVRVRMFLDGKNFLLPDALLDTDSIPRFPLRALRTLRDRVPAGKVVSYGRLAEMTGSPGAARAIGSAMARNPFPLFFPCHRVVKSDMSLGEYGCGKKLKLYLLEMEGVVFKDGKAGRNYFL